jgi:hypothetical protein
VNSQAFPHDVSAEVRQRLLMESLEKINSGIVILQSFLANGQAAVKQPGLPGSLLSTDDAAKYLAISPETLRRMCRRKAITFIQVASAPLYQCRLS